MLGKTIGEYRVLEKRGEGGMGTFYKAVDVRLDRVVGLKTLRAELVSEPELLEKLQSEAKTLAHLDHPNIARLLHYLIVENQHFIVMEFVDGLDLADKAKSEGLLPLSSLVEINAQICAAISYAHVKKVIHRDIKPSNILVTSDGRVKVTDFGIAKILGVSAHTRTGVATGSLPFMAPEQILGEAIDARTDIYQLGVTVYELATGRRPFKADNEYEMMSQHLEKTPPAPSSINPRLPSMLDDVILRALAKKPDERFASADAFEQALTAAMTPERGQETATRLAQAPAAEGVVRRPTAPVDAPTVFPGAKQAPVNVRKSEPAPPIEAPPPPHQSRRSPWIIGAAVIAVAAIAIWFWPSSTPIPAPPASRVWVTAELPAETPIDSIDLMVLSWSHPEFKTLIDTLSAPWGRISQSIDVRPGPKVSFWVGGYASDSRLLVDGSTEQEIPEGKMLRVHVDLFLTPWALAMLEEPELMRDTAAPDGVPAPPPVTHNLTIDILPFSARSTIERLWIDGSAGQARLPSELHLNPGLHTVRWTIGGNTWTDTVTVKGSASVEKHLFVESGAGRLNVSASFGGGAGSAEIFIDGEPTGKGTPVDLRGITAGPHELELRRDGFRMSTRPLIVHVKADDRTRVQVEMVPN